MEPIDHAKEKLVSLHERLQDPTYWKSIVSEADVRMKIIDPVFTDVLGWPKEDILCESTAGKLFIDYCCRIKGLNRMIVEAKKEARDLGIKEEHAARFFKLNGAVFATEAAKEGIAQGISYCGFKSAELACITNGRQWAIFRGARGFDGTETLDGQACAFGSLEKVIAKFDVFYDLLSRETVETYNYRAIFRQAEGQPIRHSASKSVVRDPDSRMMMKGDKLAADLDRIMQSFFRDLSSEQDAQVRRECFVTTSESTAAEKGLERISEELRDKVRAISTAETSELTEVIKRVQETHSNELVLLVGTKGSGKSTFIERFFADVLPKELCDQAVMVRIDLSKSGGNAQEVTKWLDEHLLDEVEEATFPNGNPSYEEIQGMCYGEYTRWKDGHAKHLYETNKTQFKIDFGKHIETYFRQERPRLYINHLLYHIVRGHAKFPCLIFDNADHFDVPFQEAVFNYAHALCSEAMCLMILPITDTTSWQLAKQGPMQSFYTESFFLPTPPTELVLTRRIEFIERRLAIEQEQSGKKPETGTGYFFSRGIPLDIENIKGFAACLQTVFIKTGQVATWIGRLANHDIRRCLQLTREIVSSPHVRVADLLAAHVAKSTMSVDQDDVKNAMIRGKYDIYFPTVHSFVQNLYDLTPEIDTSPLLPLRILHLLQNAWQGNQDNDGRYLTVNSIVDYCFAMNIEMQATTACLDALLKRGLCLSYDPRADGIKGTVKVEIAPGGRQHLLWAMHDWVYMEAMAQITPMYDGTACDTISSALKDGAPHFRRNAIATFLGYLLKEDAHFCVPPQHETFEPQERIPAAIRQQCEALYSADAIGLTTRYRRSLGRVSTWKRDSGYGFIKQDSGGPDVYLHINDVLNAESGLLTIGRRIEYDTTTTQKGLKGVAAVALN